MSVDSTVRRVVYACNGTTKSFAFHFKLFNASAAAVCVGEPTSTISEQLAYGVDFTVVLNADQETNPGGTVTLVTAPENGLNVAIISEEAYVQPMVLTPYDGFNPETLNDNADLQAIQIQQLYELAVRHLTVPPSSNKTAAQVMKDVLDTAANAADYAAQAQRTLDAAIETKEAVDNTAETVAQQAQHVADATATIVALDEDGTLSTVAGLADEIETIAPHAAGIGAVGEDLQQEDSAVKAVADNLSPIINVDQNVQAVRTDAENINAIRLVAADLGAELESTFIHDFGEWGVDDTIPELDNAGRLATIANKINAISLVADNLDYVKGAITASAEARQAAHSALASESRIQALEDQINEIVSTNYVAVSEGE